MRPNYRDNEPKGWNGESSRGAAHGRDTLIDVDRQNWYGKLYMSVVPIDISGYDRCGTYFGLGDTVYWVAGAKGKIDFTLRAADRADAKRQVREMLPHARFFR